MQANSHLGSNHWPVRRIIIAPLETWGAYSQCKELPMQYEPDHMDIRFDF